MSMMPPLGHHRLLIAAVIIYFAFYFVGSMHIVEGKKFLRCELTKTLVEKYNFDKTFMSNWICLVEHESELDTNKVTFEQNNIKKYGLFQISNRDYCAVGRSGGYCNKKCEDFTNDDIRDDVECAKMIQQRDGFKYWKGWERFCRNQQNLPNLSLACNLRSLSRVARRNYPVSMRFTTT